MNRETGENTFLKLVNAMVFLKLVKIKDLIQYLYINFHHCLFFKYQSSLSQKKKKKPIKSSVVLNGKRRVSTSSLTLEGVELRIFVSGPSFNINIFIKTIIHTKYTYMHLFFIIYNFFLFNKLYIYTYPTKKEFCIFNQNYV